jgi:Golgi SNAP receptor complex protein 1
VLTEICE